MQGWVALAAKKLSAAPILSLLLNGSLRSATKLNAHWHANAIAIPPLFWKMNMLSR